MAFRFILNDNVYFHPDKCFGNNKTRLLVANDIKYSFEKLCENRENNFAYFEAFKDIVEGANDFFEGKKTEVSGIKIINDFEILIKLNQPNYSFLEKICSEKYVIIPKEAIKKYGHKSHIGSGPFILSEHNSLKSTLIKNEKYYLKSKDGFSLPYLDTLNIIYNSSIKDQINDFTNNKIDVITQLNNKALNRLRNIIPADKEVLYQNTPLLSTYIIEFNTITEPFNNEKFRKAINLAIDKQKITDIVADQSKGLQGNGGIVHPNISNYQSNGSYPYHYNIDSAKKLISEIINEQNNPISTINLEVNNDDDFGILIAQEIMFQLNNNLGLNVNLRIVTPLYKLEKTKYARGDMAISFIQASYDNPESFLINFVSSFIPKSKNDPSFPNTTRYNNPHFDFAFKKGRRETQTDDANKYFAIAERELLNDAPVCVLYYKDNKMVCDKKLKNFSLNSLLYIDCREVYWKKQLELF